MRFPVPKHNHLSSTSRIAAELRYLSVLTPGSGSERHPIGRGLSITGMSAISSPATICRPVSVSGCGTIRNLQRLHHDEHEVSGATERAYRCVDALMKRRELMDAWAAYLFPSKEKVVSITTASSKRRS